MCDMDFGLEHSGAECRAGPTDASAVPVVVVAGPTASGKSALALAIAETVGGTVINADSMQVYRELRILTARPGAAEETRVPHRLYGVVGAAEACSAARWCAFAGTEIAAARAAGRVPVVTGGTGLYLEALMHGLSPMPDVSGAVRSAVVARLEAEGTAALHRALAERDPRAAGRIRPTDRQRLVRAWEVLEATGRSIVDWQAEPRRPPAERFLSVLLMPPRVDLYAACDRRLDAMVAAGALGEVAALDALGLDPGLPAMKALGVPEFRLHLAGSLSLDEAVARAQRATRNYAKRQVTWFRHRMPTATPFSEKLSESLEQKILSFIRRSLLTDQG